MGAEQSRQDDGNDAWREGGGARETKDAGKAPPRDMGQIIQGKARPHDALEARQLQECFSCEGGGRGGGDFLCRGGGERAGHGPRCAEC